MSYLEDPKFMKKIIKAILDMRCRGCGKKLTKGDIDDNGLYCPSCCDAVRGLA